jgi:glycine cleavage system aminomethyltransferase T
VHCESALGAVTRRAGAVLDDRLGVAAHYGSPAGELAVCVRGAGLADRSDLTKLELRGDPAVVDDLVQAIAGISPVPGGCAIAGGTWLCARSPGELIALVEPTGDCMLEAWVDRSGAGFSVADRSDDLAAIGLVGRAAPAVLSALGLLADLRAAAPFSRVHVEGVDADLLLQSDARALLLTDASRARELWAAVETAGKPLGLSYVGSEALRRFAVRERVLLGRSVAAFPR